MDKNIIIRTGFKNGGDVTFLASRAEYQQLSKDNNTLILFAIEFKTTADAQRELPKY